MNLRHQNNKKILEYLKKGYDIEPRNFFHDETIAENCDLKPMEVMGLCKAMRDEGLVKLVSQTNSGCDWQITGLGISELETTYNEKYQEQIREYEEKQKREAQKEKERQEAREDKKHKENLRWNKTGVIISLIIGSVGLIISVIALYTKSH